MITKELLSLVANEEVKEIQERIYNNKLYYKTPCVGNKFDEKILYISLDTLGRRMKEWCRNRHYIVVSALIDNECGARAKIKYSFKGDAFLDVETEYFYANTEAEAIIKATEWVAKEKGLL